MFRAAAQYIEVDVRVTDQEGRVVRDLVRDDFALLDDGVPQTVTTFSFVNLMSGSRVKPPVLAVDRDTVTNEGSGRLWVMLLGGRGEAARRVARRFVQGALGPHDEVAVVSVHGTMSSAQGFTRTRRLLLEAIDRLQDDAGPISHRGT